MRKSIYPLIALLFSPMIRASDLTVNTLVRSGNTLSVLCTGSGPALDIARKEALRSCQSSAIDQIQGTLYVRSEVIESNEDLVYHREVEQERTKYSGLNCITENERVESTNDRFTVYLRCKFYLDKIQQSVEKEQKSESSDLVVNRKDLTEIEGDSEFRGIVQSSKREILISSIPQCSTLIIRTKGPSRTVKCDSNPQLAVIDIERDEEIVVLSNGFLPKTIKLGRASSSNAMEVINVVLQRP